MDAVVGVIVVVGNGVASTKAILDFFAGTDDVVSDAVVVIAGARAVVYAVVVVVRSVVSASAVTMALCKASFLLNT